MIALFAALFLSIADKDPFEAVHDEALQRAQVMHEAPAVEGLQLDENPDGGRGFRVDELVECRFKPGGVAGSTPKFDCELPGGDTVKVKYGRSNPEVYTEVAATRLLTALGFPADRMYVVNRVRCYGCPADPFAKLQCANDALTSGGSLDDCFPNIDFNQHQDFEDAVIERPLKGRRIESKHARGWSWEELKFVDPVKGGATRAEVDALRLLAVFVGHWDNKPKNQRLLCEGTKKDDDDCEHPLAMIQDLGATFGPMKLDLARWSQTKIWADAAACRVSMRRLPYGGSTFPDAYISEEGRQLLGSRLSRLTPDHIRALFEGARFARYPHPRASARNVDNWVRAFQAKVRAIADRAPCPAAPPLTITQEPPAPHR